MTGTETELGNCYEDSARLLTEPFDDKYADWTLVHARPRLTRPPYARFGHAWLERGTSVFDAVGETTLPREVYYAVGQVEEDAEYFTYSRTEARRMVVKHGHWGPWEGLEADYG